MRSFALLLSLVACGDDGIRHIADAPASFDDAGPRGDTPVAPAPVTVTVTFDGSGVAGVSAIFTNLDGSPVAIVQTDATGAASHVLGAGGYVTVVDPFPIEPGFIASDVTPSNLYTWAGVKPGDQLVLYESNESGSATNFTLDTAAVPTATTYNATAVCQGGGGYGNGSSALLPMQLFGCTTADIYVAAYDSSNALLATLFHPALAVTADQTVDLSASDHYVAGVAATYSFTNLPSSGVQIDYDMVGSAGVLNGFAQFTGVVTGSASLAITQSALPAAEVAFVITDFATPQNTHDVYAWSPAAATSYALDASTAMLPDVTAVPVFDYATDKLAWTAGSGVAPDAILAELNFQNDPAVASWSIVAPYTDGELQFPPIAGMMPAMTDAMEIGELATANVPGGYDAIRAFALAELDPAVLARLGGSGQVLLQSYIGATSDLRHVRSRSRAHVLAKRRRDSL
ncbi:MAG TPA: hypothetical protein VH143_23555 [Kofleriaceae bacterium]|jgi:hypothetical protein|nr:hypothetical protein [Kofleriaceae bacterium]